MLKEIANILKTTEKNAPARIVGLKLSPTCGRCCGSGQYSWNAMHGSRCYGCNGRGVRLPAVKDYPGILEAAKHAAADGRLDAYIANLAATKASQNATRRVLDAWQALTHGGRLNVPAHWIRDPECTADQLKARALNFQIAAAYDRVSKLSDQFLRKKATAVELQAAMEAALKLIADIKETADA